VLGGAGDIGGHCVRWLRGLPGVDRITVADIRLDRAREFVGKLQDPRVQADGIDVADRPALVGLMRAHDVTVGAAGPFYRYEAGIVRAAVEAAAAYVSVCDDHDATDAALAFDVAARRAGARVLVGMGWTPGLSNLLARRASDSMDAVDEIRIAWAGASADAPGYAVMLHTLHIYAGEVPTFREGRRVTVRAGGDPEVVRFPPPMGEVTVYTVGHPEPITVPLHVGKGIRHCSLKGGLKEPLLGRLAVWLPRLGLSSTRSRQERLGRLVKPLLPVLERFGPRAVPCSAIRVDVIGTREGHKVTESWAVSDRMTTLTSLPAALAAHRMGEGGIRRTGVYPPEADGAVDPEWLCRAASEKGLAIARI